MKKNVIWIKSACVALSLAMMLAVIPAPVEALNDKETFNKNKHFRCEVDNAGNYFLLWDVKLAEAKIYLKTDGTITHRGLAHDVKMWVPKKPATYVLRIEIWDDDGNVIDKLEKTVKVNPGALTCSCTNTTPRPTPTHTPTPTPPAPPPTPPAPPPPAPAPPPTPTHTPTPTPTSGSVWTGTWQTDWGELVLSQTGNQVSGTYSHQGGRITGTVSGNTLIGTWSQKPSYSPPNEAGDVQLTIAADGSFTGVWKYGSSGDWSGGWNGKSIGTATTPTLSPTPTPTPGTTPYTMQLSCENFDNEENGCCCFQGVHTYKFEPQNVTSVVARFDTGRRLDCQSTVELQVLRGAGWQTIKTVKAVSSSGNSEVAPIEVQVPINDFISGFRISDGCVCCIDGSEITVYGTQAQQPTSTPTPAHTSTGTSLIAESRTMAPGGTVQVPIRLENAQNIGSLGFQLSYDPAVAQVTQVVKGSLPPTFTSNTQQPGLIIIGFATTQGVKGDKGSAVYVEFRAVGADGSTCALALSQIEATNTSGATVPITPVNGALTIGKGTAGDANGDGRINVLDALMALKMYVKLIAQDLKLDMNQDGRITPEDARLILEMAKPR